MMDCERSAQNKNRIEPVLFDCFVLLSLFLYISGSGFLFQGPLHELIGQKPWIHRAFVTLCPLLAVLWAALRFSHSPAPETWTERLGALLLNRPRLLTWSVFFILSIVWTVSSWVRHDALHTSFDMAIFVQAVWNTLHGAFLYSSIKGGICLLGDHFSPLVALLALPYAVWPDPRCLLLLQAAAAASAVFPVYRLAVHQNAKAAVLFVLAAALYLPLRNAVRFDFHPEVLTFPLLLWAFYFLECGRLRAASLCMLIALAAKENTALVLFGMGFYALFFRRKVIFGCFWMLFSVIYLTAAIRIWIPHFSGADYFYLSGNFLAWKKAGGAALLHQFISGSSLSYLVKIFGPFAFLSFLSPAAFLLTVPMLAQNLISRNEATRSIFFQYTALLTPFVLVSAIAGWKRVSSKPLAPYLLIGASVLFSGVSEIYVIEEYAGKISPHTRLIQQELADLPSSASLRTHEFLAPQAAHRRELHIFENTHPKEGGSERALASDYVALDRMFLGSRETEVYEQLEQAGYTKIKSREGFTLWQRTRIEEPYK